MDSRSDLYALAATLYHLLTGVLPAHARKRQKDVARGQADPLQPAHQCQASVPEPISRVIHAALALDRANRPPHAAALRQQLRDAAHEANITLSQRPLPPIVQPAAPSPRRRRWLAAALLTLVALIVAGLWLPQLAIPGRFTSETPAPAATIAAATDEAQLSAATATAATTATVRAATQIADRTATIAAQTAAARQATAAQATTETLATRQVVNARATATQEAILTATRTSRNAQATGTAVARTPTAQPTLPPVPTFASPLPESAQSPAPPLTSSPSALPAQSPAP